MSINTISYEVDNEINKVLYSKEIDKILIKDINDLKSDQKILFIYDKNISKKFINDFKTKLKLTGNIVFSEYLHIPYISGVGEVSVFLGAVIGSCLGFLWFNAPPAKIFMGDTGSLSLGGSLGAVGIITKHEIVLAIIGGLFVLEAISVIVQVVSFKLTGKRIFKMAPIHHHYEKKGWPESTVVIRFWIVAIILAMVGLATLKFR